jgi:hypothetical protein
MQALMPLFAMTLLKIVAMILNFNFNHQKNKRKKEKKILKKIILSNIY